MNASSPQIDRIAGIVLCGGRSQRMGRDKAQLPFGPELMVQRVVRILRSVVEPIAVVAAAGQELPPLPGDVLVARDERTGRGPLEGLLAGLRVLAGQRPAVSAAFVTSCDVPLLTPAMVREMICRLKSADAAVPIENGLVHPLAGIYRLAVLPHVAALLATDQLRPAFLLDRVATNRIDVQELRAADPELLSLKNCNRPEDYEEALRIAGLEAG